MGKSLSETVKIPAKDLKKWLESEAGSTFNPVHKKAKESLDDMRKTYEDFADASKSLMENSGKEIVKRNPKTYRRARALNKLSRLFLDRVQRIKVPNQVTYDGLYEMAQETQKVLAVTDADIRNWFPRISPFFIMDRRKFQVTFERTRLMLKDLNNFLAKEYVKTKTLEETFQFADKFPMLEKQLVNLKEQRTKLQDEKVAVEKETAEMQRRMAEHMSKGSLSQLTRVNAEIESLTLELKQNLQHLQKPFIKLQSLALHGGGSGLMQDESAKLAQYLENPFEALATEQEGYPVLRAILGKMDQLMAEKLNLKPEKERKAKQAIEHVVKNNSLNGLHQRCVNALTQRKQLLLSEETTKVQADLSRYQEQLATLERRRKVIESEENVAERACTETSEKIKNLKSQIEKNVLDFAGRRIQIQ
jgi:hypothetical protein